MRLHENRTLEASHVIRDSIQTHIAENYHWRDSAFVPRMDKWLREKGWDDEPVPAPAQNIGNGEPRKTAHQLAWEKQEQDYFNLLSKEEQAEYLKLKQEVQEAG